MIFETKNQKETYELAKKIGGLSKKGDIYTLNGNLGVGKTVFSKGFACGLGLLDELTSPTFSIVNEYKSENYLLYHFDVYRIEDEDELFEIGFYEYINNKDSIILIEWANNIKNLLPQNTIDISIQKDLSKGEDYRQIIVIGREYEDISLR